MKKSVLVLVHDYWHRRESIEPVLPLLFPETDWNVTLTVNPSDLRNAASSPDLFVSFKDVIENDQISTPLWCDDAWTVSLDRRIREDGMGFLAVHCGIADIPKEHFITQNILRAFFVTHPIPCPVTMKPAAVHPITEGIEEFTFPKRDEHYIMEMNPGTETEVLAYTESENGIQPAVWAHTYGKGRVCAATPGHSTENLSCPQYLKLLQNAAMWCART